MQTKGEFQKARARHLRNQAKYDLISKVRKANAGSDTPGLYFNAMFFCTGVQNRWKFHKEPTRWIILRSGRDIFVVDDWTLKDGKYVSNFVDRTLFLSKTEELGYAIPAGQMETWTL